MSLLDILLNPYFLVPATIWTAILTGMALWRAARGRHKVWFVIFLLIHTLGILELIYLITHKKKKQKTTEKKPTSFAQIQSADTKLSSQHEAILHILTGILDDAHQTSITKPQLQKAIQAVEDRITGKLTQQKLQNILDKPEAKGGAGLYKQTAMKIASHVEAMLKATNK